MYEDMRVSYAGVSLKYPAYIKLQALLIVGAMVAGGLLFVFARESEFWALANGWWLCLVMAVGEVIESLIAVSKAKKNYRASAKES